jgi:hypothetical protein
LGLVRRRWPHGQSVLGFKLIFDRQISLNTTTDVPSFSVKKCNQKMMRFLIGFFVQHYSGWTSPSRVQQESTWASSATPPSLTPYYSFFLLSSKTHFSSASRGKPVCLSFFWVRSTPHLSCSHKLNRKLRTLTHSMDRQAGRKKGTNCCKKARNRFSARNWTSIWPFFCYLILSVWFFSTKKFSALKRHNFLLEIMSIDISLSVLG